MAHCIIDYSEDVAAKVDIDLLIKAVHQGALASGLFPEYDIKTRAASFLQHRMGQTQDSFVHVAVHLLNGRDDAQKIELSESVFAHVEPLLAGVISVGVEICDMHRASYRKSVLDRPQP